MSSLILLCPIVSSRALSRWGSKGQNLLEVWENVSQYNQKVQNYVWPVPSQDGERLRAGGEGDDRGWDGWMATPNQWTWVWVNSGSWWWTGRPGMLWFMGLQRVGHDWATELNWTELVWGISWIWRCCWKRGWSHVALAPFNFTVGYSSPQGWTSMCMI